MRMNNCLPKWELVTTAFISCYPLSRVYLCSSGSLNAYMSFQSVTITYTNVLLFYVISFSVLIDCLLIYCVVFIVLLIHCFFYNFVMAFVCLSLNCICICICICNSSETRYWLRIAISAYPNCIRRPR